MGRSKKGSLGRSRTEGGRTEKHQGCRGLGWNVGQLGRALRPSHPPPPSEGKLLRPLHQAFHTARRTIQGFEAMLWLRKGFGFAGAWTVCEQNQLLAFCFGLPVANKA